MVACARAQAAFPHLDGQRQRALFLKLIKDQLRKEEPNAPPISIIDFDPRNRTSCPPLEYIYTNRLI